MKDKLRKLLNEFGSTAYGIMLENPEHLDEAAEEAAQTILNTLIEEVEGLRKTDPNNLASDPGKWETTIMGYNAALTDIKNLLKGDKR